MISIRTPQLADTRALVRCHIAAWRDSYRPLIAEAILSQSSLEDDYVAKWRQRLQQPDDLVFVAESDSKELLGFIQGGRERTGRGDYQGEIYLAYVLQEFRGRGIGRKLFEQFARALLDKQISSAIVWVFEENDCRYCYAAWGGEQVAASPITVGEQELIEVAYAWKDLRGIAGVIGPEPVRPPKERT